MMIWLLSCHSLLAIESHRKGDYIIENSVNDLLGVVEAERFKNAMNIKQAIKWQVYVPSNYDLNNPAGVLVYISPTPSGEIPADWKSLMDKYNLIWIAAKNSGNNIVTMHRMNYALLGANIIKSKYSITSKRIYVSGFSGGGRVASLLASEYPSLFKGAIYNSGVNFWRDSTELKLQQIKANRFVFITGRNDFNLEDTKLVYRKYKSAGVKHIKLMINPRQGHNNPKKSYYEKAIKFLDINVND